MNLLLVDDDVLLLKDILRHITASALRFDSVLTAASADEALKIISRVSIQVLVCDIEMPGISGLELLEALNRDGRQMQTILLTSHTRFEYAQRAVKLGTLEYLVKPVSPGQLETALANAAERANAHAQEARQRLHGQYWLDERKNMAELYWFRVAQEKQKSAQDMAERLGYPGKRFIPALLEAFPQGNLEIWDIATFEYAIKNITEEVMQTAYFHLEAITRLPQNSWLVVLETHSLPAADSMAAEMTAQELLDALTTVLETEFCFGLADAVPLEECEAALLRVEEMFWGTAQRRGRVMHIRDYRPQSNTYSLPSVAYWESLLENGRVEELDVEIQGYLQRQLAADSLTPATLLAFQQDTTQLVYSYLRRHEIQAHRLFDNETSRVLAKNASLSVDDMILCCRDLAHRALEYSSFSADGKSVVEKVTEYLDGHFHEDTPRGRLAALVFVSPDYLSRLFRRETGKTLAQYVAERRLEHAAALLREGSMPINAIAMQVGFSSFAYFSKMFRERHGMTPMDYRRQHRAQQ